MIWRFLLSTKCYKVNPAMPSIYAVGTYSRGLAVYLEPQPHTLCYLDGQKGGITYIKFSPDGTKLLAGGRKDDEILVWDMRNPGKYIQLRPLIVQIYSLLTQSRMLLCVQWETFLLDFQASCMRSLKERLRLINEFILILTIQTDMWSLEQQVGSWEYGI